MPPHHLGQRDLSKMYELITPPTQEPIDLGSLKKMLRVDHDIDDTLIVSLQQTARTLVERRYDLALLTQVWRGTFSGAARSFSLRPSIVQSVASVRVLRGADEIDVTPDAWSLCRGRPATVEVSGVSLLSDDRIQIDFVSGYSDLSSVPADLLRAVALLTAHYYEERELFRAQRYVPVPHSVDALMQPYREVLL